MATTIRRIRPDDGALLRRVRLEALLDAPYAYASSHAEEATWADSFWSRRAAEGASGSDAATFFAVDEMTGDPIGLVGAHRRDPRSVELVSMWTAPSARQTGVGAALVGAVLEFAHPTEVRLWVTRGNDRAQRLYERCGFEVTEEIRPLPSDPCKDEIRMRHCPR